MEEQEKEAKVGSVLKVGGGSITFEGSASWEEKGSGDGKGSSSIILEGSGGGEGSAAKGPTIVRWKKAKFSSS